MVGEKGGRKDGNVSFNGALNTFNLWVYDVEHMVMDWSLREEENPVSSCHGLLSQISSNESFKCIIPQTGRKEIFYLTMHSTHFIYGYMA